MSGIAGGPQSPAVQRTRQGSQEAHLVASGAASSPSSTPFVAGMSSTLSDPSFQHSLPSQTNSPAQPGAGLGVGIGSIFDSHDYEGVPLTPQTPDSPSSMFRRDPINNYALTPPMDGSTERSRTRSVDDGRHFSPNASASPGRQGTRGDPLAISVLRRASAHDRPTSASSGGGDVAAPLSPLSENSQPSYSPSLPRRVGSLSAQSDAGGSAYSGDEESVSGAVSPLPQMGEGDFDYAAYARRDSQTNTPGMPTVALHAATPRNAVIPLAGVSSPPRLGTPGGSSNVHTDDDGSQWQTQDESEADEPEIFQTADTRPQVPDRTSSAAASPTQERFPGDGPLGSAPLLHADTQRLQRERTTSSSSSDYGPGDSAEVEIDYGPPRSPSMAAVEAATAKAAGKTDSAKSSRAPSRRASFINLIANALSPSSASASVLPTSPTTPRAPPGVPPRGAARAVSPSSKAPALQRVTSDEDTVDAAAPSTGMPKSTSGGSGDLNEVELQARLEAEADADPSRPRTLKEARALAKERARIRKEAGASEASPPATASSVGSGQAMMAASSSERRSMDRPRRDPKRTSTRSNTLVDADAPPRDSFQSERSVSDYGPEQGADADASIEQYRKHGREEASVLASNRSATESPSDKAFFPSAQTNSRRFGQVSPQIGASADGRMPNSQSATDLMQDLQAAVGDALDDLSFGSGLTGETAMPSTDTTLARPRDAAVGRTDESPKGTPVQRYGFDQALSAPKGSLGPDGHALARTMSATSADATSDAHSASSFNSAVENQVPVVMQASQMMPAKEAQPPQHPLGRDGVRAVPQRMASAPPTKLSVYGRTAAWPSCFDPTPIIEKRKLAPWERARAYAQYTNQLSSISTGLEVWLMHVQRPAQAQVQRAAAAAAAGNARMPTTGRAKGAHGRDFTDSSAYAASVRSDATFPMRGDGGRAKDITAHPVAPSIPESPPSAVPANIPYPALLPSNNSHSASPASSLHSQPLTLTRTISNEQSAGSAANQMRSQQASANAGAARVAAAAGGAAAGGPSFFSGLSRKGSRRGPQAPLSVAPPSPAGAATAVPVNVSSPGGPRGPRMAGSKGRAMSIPLTQYSPTQQTSDLPSMSSVDAYGRRDSEVSPTSRTVALPSPNVGTGRTSRDEPQYSVRTSSVRSPLGPRAPGGAPAASSSNYAAESPRTNTMGSISGLGGGEQRGQYYGLSPTGGIYGVPTRGSTGELTSDEAPMQSSPSDYRGPASGVASARSPRSPFFRETSLGSDPPRGSPQLQQQQQQQHGTPGRERSQSSGATQMLSSPQLPSGPVRSSFSYGSVRERSPQMPTSASQTLRPPGTTPSPSGSGSSPKLGQGRKGSFSSSGNSAGDSAFEETLNKLEDVLPDADRATLAVYLKKAGGNDLTAIGDYLQDQSRGKTPKELRRPSHGR